MTQSNDVVFEIRGDRGKLAGDLRGAEKDIIDSAKRAAAGANSQAKAAGESTKSMLSSISEVYHEIGKSARVFALLEAAVTALNLSMAGTKLITSAITGDYESQVKAAKEATDAVKAIPFVGDKILSLGATINKYTLELVTHEQAYVDKIKKATIEQEKHTKVLEDRVKKGVSNVSAATGVVAGVGANDAQSTEVAFAAKIKADRENFKNSLQGQGIRDSKGNLTETGKALSAEGNKRINSAIGQNAGDEMERAKAVSAQTEILTLKSLGKTAEAERAEQLETNRQKMVAAAKISEQAVKDQQMLNDLSMKAYDEQVKVKADADKKEADTKAVKEYTDYIQLLDKKRAENMKDQKEAEERQIKVADLNEKTREMALKRKGHGNEADARSIVYAANEQVKAAGGDKAMQMAILAQANEQLYALKPETREAVVTGGRSALNQNLFGGTAGRDSLQQIQKDALGYLKKIAENLPAGARAA